MQAGDIVVLKSGGPQMTISSIRTGETSSYAFCKWFDDLGQLHTEKFAMVALKALGDTAQE